MLLRRQKPAALDLKHDELSRPRGLRLPSTGDKTLNSLNHSVMQTAPRGERWRFIAIALILLTSAIAISQESFWIDELTTAYFGGQPSINAMWQEMIRFKWPELQAPLYMVYVWLWSHFIGNEEWILRSAGLPWFLLGASVFVHSFRSSQQRLLAAGFVALHPFAWFYLNEARLYSIELGLTFMLFASLVQLYRLQEVSAPVRASGWLGLLCGSALALSLISALGMIWTIAAFVAVPAIFPKRGLLRWARERYLLVGSTFVAFVPCALYYIWTGMLGTSPSGAGGGTNWRTLVFIGYELLGFNGFGPGRFALRETGAAALRPWIGILLVYAAALAVVGFAALVALRREKHLKLAFKVAIAVSVPLALLVGLGFSSHFRLLGRHCAPLVVPVAFVLILGVQNLWQSGQVLQRGIVFAFLGLSLISCYSQRFALRHAKDDYRRAATIAKTALSQNKSVWWNAESLGCHYYKVPATKESPVLGSAWILAAPIKGFHEAKPAPDTVIFSKPDAYDYHGAVRAFLTNNGYVVVEEFPAFKILRRSKD